MSNNHDNWFKQNDEQKVEKTPIKRAKKPFTFYFKKRQKNKVKVEKPKYEPKTKIGKVAHKSWGGVIAGFNSTIHFSKKVVTSAKAKPLLTRILYTVLLILIFRIAASITTPGVSVNSSFAKDSSSFMGIMNMMGGGTLKNFSIVALGISPYITASIIMQLLQSEAFPPVYRLARSGPAGKRKINIITRCVTLVFAILSAITMIQQFSSRTGGGMIQLASHFDTPVFKFFVLPMILIGGSMFTLFLGEQITNRGIGNGTSLIIFSGIAVDIPAKFKTAYEDIVGQASANSAFVGVMNFLIYVAVILVLLFVITYIYKAERHIPIQQTGAGMTTDTKQMSRLPIKLNPGGVMPIIFALMIIALPLQVAQFLNHQSDVRQWIEHNMTFTAPLGLCLMIGLIMLFSVAMSFVTFNPATVADNFKKSGTFIPGVRPGEESEKYLSGVIIRLSIFSGVYLSIVTAIQYIEEIIGLSPAITFGGTSLIILVSVAIETMSQLKARDTTHKISKAKVRSLSTVDGDTTGGLLW